MTLDLSALPEPRRARVLRAYRREAAAEAIRAAYPAMLLRYKTERAIAETSDALKREYPEATPRYVKSVMRERR